MNKKVFWVAIFVVIVGGFVFYKGGFWYDVGHYLKLPGYGMLRTYCDFPPCESTKVSNVFFSDNSHVEFMYPISWKVGKFTNYPNEYTLQPADIFVPEARNNSIIISITGHCMNTQCLTMYNLDDMVREMNAQVVGTARAQNITGYEVLFPDEIRGYMFIKGKDLVTISTDVYGSYMKDFISTLKLLAVE